MAPVSTAPSEGVSSLSRADVEQSVRKLLPEGDGFEIYPFRIGSYNATVGADFQLAYDANALGLLVLSTPAMFDVSFKRWVKEEVAKAESFEAFAAECTSPISEFVYARVEAVEQSLMERAPFEVLHDHSFWPNKKPKILMCTCGHVAGAAYYYRQEDLAGVSDDSGNSSDEEKWNPAPAEPQLKFIGLSLHPRYGGHFAFRCALIFPTVKVEEGFEEPSPKPVLNTLLEKRDALEKFNYAWRDSSFRDCGNPTARYSETQQAYFGTPPADRWAVVRHWIDEGISE